MEYLNEYFIPIVTSFVVGIFIGWKGMSLIFYWKIRNAQQMFPPAFNPGVFLTPRNFNRRSGKEPSNNKSNIGAYMVMLTLISIFSMISYQGCYNEKAFDFITPDKTITGSIGNLSGIENLSQSGLIPEFFIGEKANAFLEVNTSTKLYYIQVAAYLNEEKALEVAIDLRNSHDHKVFIGEDSKGTFKVLLEGFTNEKVAKRYQIQHAHLSKAFIQNGKGLSIKAV